MLRCCSYVGGFVCLCVGSCGLRSGMAVHSNGDTHFGLKIESVLDNDTDHISLDYLARVLMDIRQDSSQIIDSLISSYQVFLSSFLLFYCAARNSAFFLSSSSPAPSRSCAFFLIWTRSLLAAVLVGSRLSGQGRKSPQVQHLDRLRHESAIARREVHG